EERYHDRSNGDGGRRSAGVPNDLFGNGGQRRLNGFRVLLVAVTVTAVANMVDDRYDRIVVGNIRCDAQSNGMRSVVQISERFLGVDRGIGADDDGDIDEIRVIVQRARVKNLQTVHGEGDEPGGRRRQLLLYRDPS